MDPVGLLSGQNAAKWQDEPDDPSLEAIIQSIKQYKDSEDIEVIRVEGISLTMSMLKRLIADEDAPANEKWLTGEVIEAFLKLVESKRDNKYCTVMSTYFYEMIEAKGVEATLKTYRKTLRKFTENLDTVTLIMPIALSNHWTLAVLHRLGGQLNYYDSMGNEDSDQEIVCGNLIRAIETAEICQVRRVVFAHENPSMPKQTNGWDCGPFVCMYGRQEIVRSQEDLSYTQENMPQIRKSIMYSLLRSTLDGQEEMDTGDISEIVEEIQEEEMKASVPEPSSVHTTGDQHVQTDDMMETEDWNKDIEAELDEAAKKIEGLDVLETLKFYRPDPRVLEKLRTDGKIPFVDLIDGVCKTANHNNDWRKMLNLREILDDLVDGDQERGWLNLRFILRHEPSIAIHWGERVATPGQLSTPTSFRFGMRCMFVRVKRIVYEETGIRMADPFAKFRRQKKKEAKRLKK